LRSIEALDFADETINATIDAYLADFPSGVVLGILGAGSSQPPAPAE
jgi:hypothetical protein